MKAMETSLFAVRCFETARLEWNTGSRRGSPEGLRYFMRRPFRAAAANALEQRSPGTAAVMAAAPGSFCYCRAIATRSASSAETRWSALSAASAIAICTPFTRPLNSFPRGP